MKTWNSRHGRGMNISVSNSVNAFNTLDQQEDVPFAYGPDSRYTIEQHLLSFADEAPYDILCASWKLEKDAYQKRLSTIPLTFPAFSSHGADHSEVILARIEALLGESRIRLLSPTDAWLLLQCAYTHDIGMCVADKEKDALFSEIENNPSELIRLLNYDDFKSFLANMDYSPFYASLHTHDRFIHSVRFLRQMIERNDQDEVRRFVQQVEKTAYSQAKNILSTVASRYFRARHAERTRDILIREAPNATLNGSLPERLRKTVAEIDYCHGTPWMAILTNLPPKDNGLSTDHIHPQFIAALLRLGDLLDLDSNRYNPFQLELIGRLPRESAVHRIKHMAITRFMVDTQWIDIEARYRYEEVADFLSDHYYAEGNGGKSVLSEEERRLETRWIMETSSNALRDWIGWLHDDLKEFSHHWNAVVPEKMTGYIAALRTSNIYLDDSPNPVPRDELELRYAISPRRASQIIEGSELYNDSLVFIRELTQNAIDTSKRQIYKSLALQRDNDLPQKNGGDIQEDALFVPNLKKYKVSVHIAFTQQKGSAGAPDTLEICFRDNGIGITYDKLKQMRHIGAISLSEEEREELQEMPQWIQPTGEFGIGMQSVFSVVSSFYIKTYPRYEKNGERTKRRTIRLFCPELGGDIVNAEDTKAEDEKMRFGSDVIVQIPLVHETIMQLFRVRNPKAFNARSSQLLDTSVIIERIRRYILETFTDDVVSLEFTYEPWREKTTDSGRKIETLARFSFPEFQSHSYQKDDCYLFLKQEREGEEPAVCYWYNKLESRESVLLTLRNAEKSKVRLYYKGIVVSGGDESSARMFRIPGVDVSINLMSGNAGELLEISRDYIKPTGYKILKDLVQHAMMSFYQAAYTCITCTDESEEKEKAAFCRFFSHNPEHMMCFYHILRAMKDQDVDADFVKLFCVETVSVDNVNAQDEKQPDKLFQPIQNPIMPESMCILHGKMYISQFSWHEAIHWIQSNTIWYTDYPFETLFSSNFELREGENEVMCALYDNLSEMYGLTYDKLRIIQDKTWKTKYIKIYTLTEPKENRQYPEFVNEEYLRLCLITVNEYLDRYNAETDPMKKSEIGNYILSFPAAVPYQALAVEKLPAESPSELAARYRWFIVCPCKVEKLAGYFEYSQHASNHTSALAYMTEEALDALFDDVEVQGLISRIPLTQTDLPLVKRKSQYRAFFGDFAVFHEHT